MLKESNSTDRSLLLMLGLQNETKYARKVNGYAH